MRAMTKRVVWIVVLLLVAGGLYLAFRPRALPVDLGTVTRGPVRSFVEEEGKTRVQERYVVSAPVSGRMARIPLEEGDTVEAGETITTIDPLPMRARIDETEAQITALEARRRGVDTKPPKPAEIERARALVRQADAALKVAEQEKVEADAALVRATKDLERERTLVASGSGTPQALDTAVESEKQAGAHVEAAARTIDLRKQEIEAARLQVDVLEATRDDFDWEKDDLAAQIESLRARLVELRDDLKRTEVTAPVKGVVLELHEESQREVVEGTPLLSLGDLETLEVEAEFLSEDAAHMRVGMKAEVFGRALADRVVPAEVTRIYPSAFTKISSLGVEQQRVYVIVRATDGSLRLGDEYRVEVRVILDERADALLVPEGALFRHDDGWGAFRVDGGTAELVTVATGLRNGRVREVLSGLGEGDRVILHPDASIGPGARVEPLPQERR